MSSNKDLLHSFNKAINTKLDHFFDDLLQALPDNHSITKKQLFELWNKKQIKKTRKKSAYLNFSKHFRQQLKQTEPSLSFSEIARKLSMAWKNLSETEKNKYKED